MMPLSGIRVLDFGRYIAGPFCAALLGDLGADVIRVEKIGGSEDRGVGPVTDGGDGAMFLQCNRGKRSLTLNPMAARGREVVRRLVAQTDVVVANLPHQTLTAMGLDFDSLSAENPRVVLASISAFGDRGPYAHRTGFDAIGQAMNGSMYLSGVPEEPMRAAVNYVDFATALSSALGTVAALLARERTGKGQVVGSSLLGSAININNAALMEQALLGINRVATKNRSQLAAPSDTFHTLDGWIVVQCVGDPLFKRWAELVGEPTWLIDERFRSDALRGRNGALISERMAAWCSTRTTDDALLALDRAGLPAGRVCSPQQALDDPHVQGAEMLKATRYPGAPGPVLVAAPPFSLSACEERPPTRAPLVGEHTDAILSELGYDAAAILDLRAENCI